MKTFIEWLIKRYLKGYHLSKNPPKGIRKPRNRNMDDVISESYDEAMRNGRNVGD